LFNIFFSAVLVGEAVPNSSDVKGYSHSLYEFGDLFKMRVVSGFEKLEKGHFGAADIHAGRRVNGGGSATGQ